MKFPSLLIRGFGIFLCFITLFGFSALGQEVQFDLSLLQFNGFPAPVQGTALKFGPDGRLYMSELNGQIKIYTIVRTSSNVYTVVAAETFFGIQNIPNHDDVGSLAFDGRSNRQVTGLTVAGTAQNPVLYVASSDPKWGGPSGDKVLDTNSGILTRLTWTGSSWDMVDLVRGLPRSEENHSPNGLEYVLIGGKPYILLTSGGFTNAGSPSINFAYITEYALSGAILSIDLQAIDAFPTQTDPNSGRKFKYDIPTLDDPSRPNVNGIYDPNDPNYNGIDVGDPFGGNDGLNMGMVVENGPVQIFSPGYRNAYDLVVTESGKVFVTDNGANANWGGLPFGEGNASTVNNSYVTGEPGNNSTNPSPNGEFVTNEDRLLMITGDLQNYQFGSFYGGHPAPIRANPGNVYPKGQGVPFPYSPGGAGLYTNTIADNSSSNGTPWVNLTPLYTPSAHFRTQVLQPVAPGQAGFDTYARTSLPANWPPVPISKANAANADYRDPILINPSGPQLDFVTIWSKNTNAITEYKSNAFQGAIRGALIAGKSAGRLHLVTLNEDGSLKQMQQNKWNLNGGNALGLTSNGDSEIFPGTIWVSTFDNRIHILTPADNSSCPLPGDVSFDPDADYDNDGFSNQDELDNGTDYCSGASAPNDFDGDKESDLNDLDDDDDNLLDALDPFQLGNPTDLPINNELFSDKLDELGRPFGYRGLGLTGLMNNGAGKPNWLDWLDKPDVGPLSNDIYGGAAGAIQVAMTPGTANGTSNTQEKGFQFGVNVGNETGQFVITAGLIGLSGPQQFYDIDQNGEIGIQIGDGTQQNFFKLVFTKDGIVAGIEVDDVPDPSPLNYPIPSNQRPGSGERIDFILRVNPLSSTVEPFVQIGSRPLIALGVKTLQGKVLTAVQDIQKPLAIGIYGSTMQSGVEFFATFDYFRVVGNQPIIVNQFGNLSRQAGSDSRTYDLTDFFDDDNGAENLLFSVTDNSNPEIGARINGSNLTVDIPLSPNEGTISVRATDVNGLFVEQQLLVSVTAARRIIYRINAGGEAVAGENAAPNWQENSISGSVQGTGYSVNSGVSNPSNLSFANIHSSVPNYISQLTFEGIFTSERESQAGSNMTFSIPVTNSDYILNLYFGNSNPSFATIGSRVFDIKVEDVVVLSNFDLVQQFGNGIAGMVEIPVSVADGMLTIEFVTKVGAPIVNAIELLSTEVSPPIVIETAIPDQTNQVNEVLDGNLLFTASGGVGTLTYSASNLPPGVEIESVNGRLYGTIAPEALAGSPYTVSLRVTDSNSPLQNTEESSFIWTITPFESWNPVNEAQNYTARHENSFVQAGKNFYVMGGRENATSIDVYDFQANIWREITNVAPLSFNHFQAVEYRGYIWIVGAFENNSYPNETPSSHVWIFDPVQETYFKGPEIPSSRRRGSAGTVIYKDKIYVVGGNRLGHSGQYVNYFDVLDPATGAWTELAAAPRPRDHFHAVVIGDKLYLAGGRLTGGDGGVFGPVIKEVDVYDFITQTWSTLPSHLDIPTGRGAPIAANLNNKLIVAGGEIPESTSALTVTEIFDPVAETWVTGAPLNFRRHGTQAIVSGQGLFVAGGSPNRGGGRQRNMEFYGINNPVAQELSESQLTGPSLIEFNGSGVIQFNLDVSGGTQGIYIDSMFVTPSDLASGFSFTQGYLKNSVIPPSSSHAMQVESNLSGLNGSGSLVVVYNKLKQLVIPISVKSKSNLAEGLVGYWKMNEGSGSQLLDASGNNFHATILNNTGIVWVEGREGLALRLNGQVNRFGSVPHNSQLNLNSGLSISAWIKPTSLSRRQILSKGGPDGYELSIFENGKVEFRINRESNATTYRLQSIQNYPTDGQTWMHVAVTFDGSSTVMYINGIQDNAQTFSLTTIKPNTAPLQIGARGGINRWIGDLDDIRLYGRALSASEVLQLVQGEILLPSSPVLISPQNGAENLPVSNVQLTWSPVELATGYRVQVAKDAGFNEVIFDEQGVPASELIISSLEAGSRYYWRVASENENGVSSFSDYWIFNTESAILNLGLLAHWKADEGSGNQLIDASGNNHHATILNPSGVSWREGVDGLAIRLTGQLNRFGSVPHSESLNVSTELTISAWIRPTSTSRRQILSKGGPDGYELSIFENGKVEFRINRESSATTYRIQSVQSYPSDGLTWMHVAVTFNGTTTTLYLNGVQDNVQNYPATTIKPNSTALQIGARDGNNRWTGDLDEIRLYGRALSASEIASLVQNSQNLRIVGQGRFDFESARIIGSEEGTHGEMFNKPRMYPNPVDSEIILELPKFDQDRVFVSIHDLKGVKVYESEIETPNEKHKIDISNLRLPPGGYVLRINGGSYPILFKFIKR